jgi:hypothetical protein
VILVGKSLENEENGTIISGKYHSKEAAYVPGFIGEDTGCKGQDHTQG